MLLFSVISLLLFVALAVVSAIRIHYPTLSVFELKRRLEIGDARAHKEHLGELYRSELQTLLRLVTSSLLVVLTLVAVTGFGIVWGGVVTLVSIFLIGSVSRLFARPVQGLYNRHSSDIINIIEQYPIVRLLLRGPKDTRTDYRIHSRDELTHLITHSNDQLTSDETKLLLHGMKFEAMQVEQLMVPASEIHSIPKRELLGPLVLDDLHQTGHSHFPVTDGSIHTVVGILHLRDLLNVHASQHSPTAEKAMEPSVFYIRSNDSLQRALGAFLQHHQHILIVVDQSGQTVGLITIKDVMEALFGRRLDKES